MFRNSFCSGTDCRSTSRRAEPSDGSRSVSGRVFLGSSDNAEVVFGALKPGEGGDGGAEELGAGALCPTRPWPQQA